MNLNDIKLALVGDGGVGKTSLVKALNSEKFANTESTDGLSIKDLNLKTIDFTINLKIWDFGGQEIYHAVHQMFLTKRTIYLVVVDSRQENNLFYWLKTIKKLLGNVPVIIVINKIDIYPSFDLNQKDIKKEYQSVSGFVKTSCVTLEGIENLKDLIISTVKELDFINTIIPESWNRVRKNIESLNRDYISYEEYVKLCKNEGIIDRITQNIISDYFHDLGIIIHFKNLKLFDTQIINPYWITEAIYWIINSAISVRKIGILDISDILDIFSKVTDKYPKNKINYILGIMEEFELLINFNNEKFLIPQLLKVQEPDNNLSTNDCIKIVYRYDFLPTSLFNRIVIRIANKFSYDNIWRYGLLFTNNSESGIIKNLRNEQSISINVKGKNKRELLFLIREIIRNVNNSYSEIKIEELIPIESSQGSSFISYSHLLAYQEHGKEFLFNPTDGREIRISELLESIEPGEKYRLNPIKVFISYSHKDSKYKLELLNHLSPLIRLEEVTVWEDGEIIPGQEWENKIMTKLQESDIILCLISSDFIASDFCYSIELEDALNAHIRNERVLIPVFIRACYWKKLPIAKIQGIPKIPISSQENSDEGWEEVVMGIDKSIELMKKIRNE